MQQAKPAMRASIEVIDLVSDSDYDGSEVNGFLGADRLHDFDHKPSITTDTREHFHISSSPPPRPTYIGPNLQRRHELFVGLDDDNNNADNEEPEQVYNVRNLQQRNEILLDFRTPEQEYDRSNLHQRNVTIGDLDEPIEIWERWPHLALEPGMPGGFRDPVLARSPAPTSSTDDAHPFEPQPVTKDDILAGVMLVFPDICVDYLSKLCDESAEASAEQIIADILDTLEKGTGYPKAAEKRKELKRKREVDEDDQAIRDYGSIKRKLPNQEYMILCRSILSMEFSHTPMVFIDATLKQCNYLLFPSYQGLEEAQRTWSIQAPTYNKIRVARKSDPAYSLENVKATLSAADSSADLRLVLEELVAARRIKMKAEDKLQAEAQAKHDEEEHERQAIRDGTMAECGCCCGDFPLDRMIHCNNEAEIHFFCRGCAKQTAETQIGLSKYELVCMSTESCNGGFSRNQRALFLDKNTEIALDRNEAAAVLRMAGIENLETCPFCPFAAEQVPVKVDRIFNCLSCKQASCRLCRLVDHIPKTCEENQRDIKKEKGLSVRHVVEEAMSAAMIRTCNKCKMPFIKDVGCNKMTCTAGGCHNVQCYVCGKSCAYDHFDDARRGGKSGNCPLFDSVENRHEQEVSTAQKDALAKIRAERPEFAEEDLKISVSERVKQDDQARKVAGGAFGIPVGVLAAHPGYAHRRREQQEQQHQHQHIHVPQQHQRIFMDGVNGGVYGIMGDPRMALGPGVPVQSQAPAGRQIPVGGFQPHPMGLFGRYYEDPANLLGAHPLPQIMPAQYRVPHQFAVQPGVAVHMPAGRGAAVDPYNRHAELEAQMVRPPIVPSTAQVQRQHRRRQT